MIDASSGEVVGHRPQPGAGNWRLNRALHIAALAHERRDRAAPYYAKKLTAEGPQRNAALPEATPDRPGVSALVHDRAGDERHQQEAGPGGHSRATAKSSVG